MVSMPDLPIYSSFLDCVLRALAWDSKEEHLAIDPQTALALGP